MGPHRVDNKGSTSRIALLLDVRVASYRKLLKKSDLGKSILKATDTIRATDATDTYLKMGRSLYEYICGLTAMDRYETEWHRQAWSKPCGGHCHRSSHKCSTAKAAVVSWDLQRIRISTVIMR